MILIVAAHPYLNRSKANKRLLDGVSEMDSVIISDIYEKYPDFHIDVQEEQQLLTCAEVIVFQFPLYWYNIPALLKQWQETVLTSEFAFGIDAHQMQLKDKQCIAVTTTGHPQNSNFVDGVDVFSVNTFMIPLQQLTEHCLMNYHEPLVFYQVHQANNNELKQYVEDYKQKLMQLSQPMITA